MLENMMIQNAVGIDSQDIQLVDLYIEQLDCRVEMLLAAAGCCCCCCCHEGYEGGEPPV